ncbi:MAG: linear amide C-N hydrolase, partial [Syntrophobacteraceae bacterium]
MIDYGIVRNWVVRGVIAISVTAFFFTTTASSFACSNVFVAATNTFGETHAAVARTMDLWLLGDYFGYGVVGEENTSNINIPQSGPVNAKQWTNAYGFIGQSALKTYILNDGVNTEGLYGAILELPGFTQYPEYNPEDARPQLGVLDMVTYALGTARDVPDLIDVDARTGKLLEVQPVLNAGEMDGVFTSFPGHLVFRDKSGNSVIVEWIRGKTHFYVHKAGTRRVIEIIDGNPHYKKIYRNTTAAVLTNAPPYGWHLESERVLGYKTMFNGNTRRKWAGEHMNGSGLYGCAGDYTPVSRFLRASTLARLYPKPNTQPEAMSAAYSILQSIIVPLGANPQPSAWVSW